MEDKDKKGFMPTQSNKEYWEAHPSITQSEKSYQVTVGYRKRRSDLRERAGNSNGKKSRYVAASKK